MTENYVMLDLNDPRIAGVADVISNKTCKKILGLLAEGEKSESELAKELGLNLNTIGYNIKKLVDAGLIDKTKNILWSVKGKRIAKYKISNKKIVISPRGFSKSKALVISILAYGLIALGIKGFYDRMFIGNSLDTSTIVMQKSAGSAGMISESGNSFIAPRIPEIINGCVSVVQNSSWAWFLLGTLIGILIYLLVEEKMK